MKIPGQTCDCDWQQQPNQIEGGAVGYSLVSECDTHRQQREAQAAAAAAQYAIDNSPYKKFDYTAFEGRMIQVLPQARWFQLAVGTGVAYTMMRLIEYPGRSVDNFTRFKSFIEGLMTPQMLTLEEVDQIKALFLEQGVDLNAI